MSTHSNIFGGDAPAAHSSTRVTHAPGGASSISFGNHNEPRQMSSNSFACGASQNTGNVLCERSSSRVLAPPGGHQSFNIFGGGDTGSQEPSGGRRQQPQQQQQPAPQQQYAPSGISEVGKRAVSSNAFANGASQNTGNSITDRPTSRVLAPPGGHQSFNIFGGGSDDTAAAPAASGRRQQPQSSSSSQQSTADRGQSSNAFANGASQNTGNVITDRSSSRVLAPPGGHQSFNIFGGETAARPVPQREQYSDSRTAAREAENRSTNTHQQRETAAPVIKSQQSSNAFANGASQNTGNVITDRPSSRVTQPAGGKNSMGNSFAW